MRVIRTFARSQGNAYTSSGAYTYSSDSPQHYIRLMTGSPLNSHKPYRVSVIESELKYLIVNRNTVILDSMPKRFV